MRFSSGDSHNIPRNSIYVTGLSKDNEAPPEGVDYIPPDITTAAEIAVGESWINGTQIMGRIEHEDDQDWYRTDLQRNHCYQIDIWGKEMYEHYKDNDAFHVDELTFVDPSPHRHPP